MAITRIQNNQITDSSAGNVYLGVNAAAKVQDFSVTGGKLQNNLTYGSDFTITGNLTVQGNTTTIDTVNLTVEDPLILLAKEQTGSPTLDIGYIGKRGTSDNIAFVWDESADEFVTVFTTSENTNTVITISSYASLRSYDVAVTGNLTVTGTSDFNANVTMGNITFDSGANINVGNNRIQNVATPSVGTDAANKDYVDGVASSGFDIEDDTANTTTVSGGDTLQLLGTANQVSVLVTGNDQVTFALTSNVSVAGNVTGGNLVTGGVVSSTGNVIGGNLVTGGVASVTGNVIGGNILTAGVVSATGNVTGNYILGNGAFLTGIDAAQIRNGTSNVQIPVANGNVEITVNGVADLVVINQNGGDVTGYWSVSGNVTGGNVVTGGVVSATGNATAANMLTGGVVSATGNVTGGNLVTGGIVSATGNLVGNNISAAGFVSATGNVNGLNVNTAKVASSGGITISSGGSSDLVLDSAGNINADSNYINNVGYPVQNGDAATKLYVDNMVSSGLTYHQAVVAATTANLATTTGGTITYNQPNGAGNGIGATITTTGSFNLIDTANVQTANTRILVKDEGNAVLNGVYVWSNATVITRSTDADEYGPNSVEQLSYNDYFFVSSGNINKGSAWVVDEPTGNITFGTSNIAFAQFSSSQTYTANTQAGLVLNGTVFSAKVDNDTTAFDGGGNIIVKASANLVTPNIGAATGTSLSTTGTITAGNLATGGTVSATGNATAANMLTGGVVSATGNVTGGNVVTGGLVSATGNVTGGNLVTSGIATITGTVTAGNVDTGGTVSATGNVTGGNFLTGGVISATGNLNAGNVTTGIISATGNINGTGAVFSGNVSAANFIGNISGNIDAAGANTEVQFNNNDLLGASSNFTFNTATNILTVTGTIQGTTVSATGNVIGGNVSTAGLVTATGNVTGGNLSTAGLVTATGNVTGGNVLTGGAVSATGNITGANLILTSGTVDGPAAGIIAVNGSGLDTDFSVSGDTVANVFYVDAGLGTTSFGNSGAITNAIASFNTTDSILLPKGTTAQRPAPATVGMFRFNTTNDAIEVYNSGTGWVTVEQDFTVIVADSFTGNGVQTIFTLSEDSTTAGTIVSINGVVQIPTTAYSVSGNALTFTEAPGPSDTIDARILTTSTTVASLSNASGNATVECLDAADTVQIEGNLLPSANITYNLGSPTRMWKNGYFAGNTIFLGNLQLKQADASTFAVYTSDGVTQANIDVGSVDVSSIISGTTVIGIGAPNGNAYLAPAGSNALVAASTGVFVTGLLSATGNITGGNVSATNLTGTLTTAAQTNITSVGTLTSLNSGAISSSGNVTAANLLTGGLISAAGNITGNYILGNGSLLTGIDATSIQSGTSNVRVVSSGGNVTVGVGGAGNVGVFSTAGLDVTGNVVATGAGEIRGNYISASGNIVGAYIFANGSQLTGMYGNANVVANLAALSSNPVSTTGNVTAGNFLTAGLISATGNITGGNLNVTGNIVDTGALSIITSSNGNITLSPGGTGVIIASRDLLNGQANGVGNIGNSTGYFNTIFAKATSAQYADLAEMYEADGVIEPGTVVEFGGTREVTTCGTDGSRRVAGVVSTNPSYIMNAGLAGDNVVAVALTGRVPTRVTGTVRKGDLMVAAGSGRARAEANPAVGAVIGKALADFEGAEGTIEVVVGRL